MYYDNGGKREYFNIEAHKKRSTSVHKHLLAGAIFFHVSAKAYPLLISMRFFHSPVYDELGSAFFVCEQSEG